MSYLSLTVMCVKTDSLGSTFTMDTMEEKKIVLSWLVKRGGMDTSNPPKGNGGYCLGGQFLHQGWCLQHN